MIKTRNLILKAVVFLGLLGVFVYLWLSPILLPAVDIGRHIKNGELLLAGNTDILYKNFYSFSYSDYPFINHHWLFGVLAYAVFKVGGFNALSFVYLGILLTGLIFFYCSALRRADFFLVTLLSMVALCVITDRREIRPEGFSALFLGLYFYLLTRFQEMRISPRVLAGILLVAQVLWVNIHIFFFMGPVLVCLFAWQAMIERKPTDASFLWKLALACLCVNIINPSGWMGMLTPLNIFRGLGYSLAENQNVLFMLKRFPSNIVYPWAIVLSGVTAVGAGLFIHAQGIRRHWPMVVLTIILLAAGLKAVRLLPFLGLFFIPLGALFFGAFTRTWSTGIKILSVLVCVGLGFVQVNQVHKAFGYGLVEGSNAAADFYKNNKLQGPIFSNYDIGGYLIYHLAPQEKVFVDNRHEAFPINFFKETYIPMQENQDQWKKMLEAHRFNTIFFYRLDMTPWGQKFLVEHIKDPDWAPVFVDAFNIIFLRRTEENLPLINQFELPHSMFGITTASGVTKA